MPGYLGFVLVTGFVTVLMLVGPRRPRVLGNLSYLVAPSYNELPLHFLALTLASAVPEYWRSRQLRSLDWLTLGLAALLAAGLVVLAVRGALARPALRHALDKGLGERWRESVEPRLLAKLDGGPNWWRVLVGFCLAGRRDVERIPDLRYGPHGRENTLDLYRLKGERREKVGPAAAPILIYLHAGGYFSGSKRLGSAELVRRLAGHGWVTISANYRLRPRAGFLEHMTDAKRVIAWARDHAAEFGADPRTIVVAGGSAGAHLATMSALTQRDPAYQQGFEDADTSVTAVVGLYGWYGGYYGIGGAGSRAGPLGHDARDAPPFLVAHGELDTLAGIETAERLATHLQTGSSNPVVYAPLPGGHHGFDLFTSLRYEAVVDAVEAFLGWVRARP